jgi:hypothetical protein
VTLSPSCCDVCFPVGVLCEETGIYAAVPVSIKADSHIPCRSHADPCHAVLLRVYIVSFPFDLHSAAVFDSHIRPIHNTMSWDCESNTVALCKSNGKDTI